MKLLATLIGLSAVLAAPAWSRNQVVESDWMAPVLLAQGEQSESAKELFQRAFKAQVAGDLVTAEELYRAVIQSDPKYALAYYNLGITLYDRGQFAEVEKLYRKSIELDPKYADAYANLGYFLLNRKQQVNEAERFYKKAIELDPKQSAYYVGMGNVMWHRKRWKDAISYYKKALELDPNNKDAKANLDRLQ